MNMSRSTAHFPVFPCHGALAKQMLPQQKCRATVCSWTGTRCKKLYHVWHTQSANGLMTQPQLQQQGRRKQLQSEASCDLDHRHSGTQACCCIEVNVMTVLASDTKHNVSMIDLPLVQSRVAGNKLSLLCPCSVIQYGPFLFCLYSYLVACSIAL